MRRRAAAASDAFVRDVATALLALRTNLMRSVLTAVGVLIGVFAVTLAAAVGAGAKVSVLASMSALGSHMAVVVPEPNRGGIARRTPDRGRLTMRDAAALGRELVGTIAVSPQLRTGVVLSGHGRRADTTLIGVTPGYRLVSNVAAERGRFVEERDVRTGARVVVLGPTVAERMFGDVDPVGRTLRVNRTLFTVVGVLESRGSTFGQDNDDLALAPLGTVRQRLLAGSVSAGPDDLHSLAIGFEEGVDLVEAKAAIRSILVRRNRTGPGDIEPFTVRTTEEFARQTGQITSILQAVLIAIASISLLVGGIGIMNIMLVSVSERTREIGLRMALGARRRQIRTQFLVEAAVLCGIGGAAGLLLAWAAARVFSHVADFPVPIGPGMAFLAVAFSAVVGLVFGAYPATRAARLSPIEALRSE